MNGEIVNERVPAAGLPDQLRGFADACRRMALGEVTLQGETSLLTALSDEHAEQVFPLIREAVSNAHRHGLATRIEITWERAGSELRLAVTDDGFLFITGRRKNLFVTAYGRNVNPEWPESELLRFPEIAQAVVFGEARECNIAVIQPLDEQPESIAIPEQNLDPVAPAVAEHIGG